MFGLFKRNKNKIIVTDITSNTVAPTSNWPAYRSCYFDSTKSLACYMSTNGSSVIANVYNTVNGATFQTSTLGSGIAVTNSPVIIALPEDSPIGVFMAAWVTTSAVYYTSIFNGTSWSTPISFSGVYDGGTVYLTLFCDSTGTNVYLLTPNQYNYGGSVGTRYGFVIRKYNAGAWTTISPQNPINSGSQEPWPYSIHCFVDTSGNIQVAWSGRNQPYLYYNTLNTSTNTWVNASAPANSGANYCGGSILCKLSNNNYITIDAVGTTLGHSIFNGTTKTWTHYANSYTITSSVLSSGSVTTWLSTTGQFAKISNVENNNKLHIAMSQVYGTPGVCPLAVLTYNENTNSFSSTDIATYTNSGVIPPFRVPYSAICLGNKLFWSVYDQANSKAMLFYSKYVNNAWTSPIKLNEYGGIPAPAVPYSNTYGSVLSGAKKNNSYYALHFNKEIPIRMQSIIFY